MEVKEMLVSAKEMLDKLSTKERDIIILRYGLDDDGQKKTSRLDISLFVKCICFHS